jgi:ATP/maltotriose-dependent transcriptional regulator MalT
VDDRQQMALAEQGIASVQFDEERWPEALDHSRRYYDIAKSISDRDGIGRGLIGQVRVLWRLGRYQEAERALEEAESISGPGGTTTPLAAFIADARASLSLSRGQFREAEVQARRVLAIPSAVPQTRASAKSTAGLALVQTGSTRDAKRLGAESVDALAGLSNRFDLAEAQLAFAQILFARGEPQEAQKQAQAALQVLEAASHKESAWRGWVILGLVHNRLGNSSQSVDDFRRATDLLTKLSRIWDAANFETYLTRPDIRIVRKSLKK